MNVTTEFDRLKSAALADFKSPRWLKPLNVYLLQWFFIRLQAVADYSPPSIGIGGYMTCSEKMEDGTRVVRQFQPTSASFADVGSWHITRWEILRWVVPCTGWWSSYRFIGKPWPE